MWHKYQRYAKRLNEMDWPHRLYDTKGQNCTDRTKNRAMI